jgi:mycofactocin precursor
VEPNHGVGADVETAAAATSDAELVTETLVEEVSIDGMCGVY